MNKALFEGLVLDEAGEAASVAQVGGEPMYVVREDGFNYHIDARGVDDQVLRLFMTQMMDNKDAVSQGMMQMMGKDDLFTKASIDSTIRNFDKNIEQIHANGIPEQARAYLGMLGFKIIINRHGDVLKVDMPASAEPDDHGDPL